MGIDPLSGPAVFLVPDRHAYLVVWAGGGKVAHVAFAAEAANEMARQCRGVVVVVPILADYRTFAGAADAELVPDLDPVGVPGGAPPRRAPQDAQIAADPGLVATTVHPLGEGANGWVGEVQTAFAGGHVPDAELAGAAEALRGQVHAERVASTYPQPDPLAALYEHARSGAERDGIYLQRLRAAIVAQMMAPDANGPLRWTQRPFEDHRCCLDCGSPVVEHAGSLVCVGCCRATTPWPGPLPAPDESGAVA
jgi:hypothetical protein